MIRVIALGSRLTLRRALKVTLSRALARSATPWTPRVTELNALASSVSSLPLGLFNWVAEAGSGVLVAEVGRGGDVEGVGKPVQGGDQAVGTGAGGVVLAAGPDRRDPERPAVGCGNDLDVAAVVRVLARPPQVGLVRAGDGNAIGTDDGAVEVEVCKAGRGRALQCGGQVWGVVGEHGQPFVEVSVDRRDGDPVVAGELSQPCTVQEPAQDQHALPERPQGASAPAGPETLAVFEQQLRAGLSSGPADIEHAGAGENFPLIVATWRLGRESPEEAVPGGK